MSLFWLYLYLICTSDFRGTNNFLSRVNFGTHRHNKNHIGIMSSNIEIKKVCSYCNTYFIAKTLKTRYCSHICNRKDYKRNLKVQSIDANNDKVKEVVEKPIKVLNEKAFLSVSEVCTLLGISRRTIYRMLERGDLIAGKFGKRTVIRRIDIDKFFELPVKIEPEQNTESKVYDISECVSTEYVRNTFGLSESTLRKLIIEHKIPKIKDGWYVYVPKVIISKLLTTF